MPAFVNFIKDLLFVPGYWRKRLEEISVPRLLDEIEEVAPESKLASLIPMTITHLVKYRAMWSPSWRKKQCLLRGLLIYYFFFRSQYEVKFHLGCNYEGDDLHGHCWVSLPQLNKRGVYFDSCGTQEVYNRESSPGGVAKRG